MQQQPTITRQDLTETLQHYATKADLLQMENRLIKWMVGLMVGSIIAAATISTTIDRLLS